MSFECCGRTGHITLASQRFSKYFASYICEEHLQSQMSRTVSKILVANRGEIALRIMRSAREMGIRTVAVYSEADRRAPHVLFADEAVFIGPAPSAESYLKGDRIISAAQNLGVDAIHPGYGFLSENAAFAEAVEQAGMIFVGPRPHAIRIMGDKLSAKAAVADFDVPLVPGSDGRSRCRPRERIGLRDRFSYYDQSQCWRWWEKGCVLYTTLRSSMLKWSVRLVKQPTALETERCLLRNTLKIQGILRFNFSG